MKCAITDQTTNNIESIRGAVGQGGNEKLFLPERERERK